jgi:hypothetical protein
MVAESSGVLSGQIQEDDAASSGRHLRRSVQPIITAVGAIEAALSGLMFPSAAEVQAVGSTR